MFSLTYLIFIAPFFLLAMWAGWRVKSTYAKFSQVPAFSGMTGAETAADILLRSGLQGARVEPSDGGHLSDHYDPRTKVVRLSPDVYSGHSLSAVGVAAHEVGHALQDAQGYAPLGLRNAIVPLANWGGSLSGLVIVVGIVLMAFAPHLGAAALIAGVGMYSLLVIFQVVNLPVELDASRRARIALVEGGIISPQENAGVGQVLNAAAFTYVAATLTAIAELLYLVVVYVLPLLGGGHRND